VAAVEAGYFHRAIEESAWQFQKEVEEGKRIIVGVNRSSTSPSPSSA
jgi:methylmalonyl-CoA mutase N-terminal domain/subunit